MIFRRPNLDLKAASLALLAALPLIAVLIFDGFACEKFSHGAQRSDLGLLSDLTRATKIHIEDDWTGLSRVAPIEAHYTLDRETDRFQGTANFSAAGYSGHPRKATAEVTIPLDVVDSFLKTLSESPIKPGTYQPRIEHTDDYPSISIELTLDKRSIKFFTKSQGASHAPWGVTIDGTTYVIESDAPAKALEKLEPHLKYDVLKGLTSSASAASSAADYADAVVYIEAGWQLNSSSTGRMIYQERASGTEISGTRNASDAASRLPVFLRLPDGSVEPALTLSPKGIPIHTRQNGSGIAVTIDGFIVTSRQAVAAVRGAYSWDPEYYGAGASLYVLDANLKPTQSQHITYEQLPSNWDPLSARLLDRRRIGRNSLEQKLSLLEVSFAGRDRVPARIVRSSNQHDVALIKVDIPEAVKAVRLEGDDTIETGDHVTAFGYPVPPGKASAVNRTEQRTEPVPPAISSSGIVGKTNLRSKEVGDFFDLNLDQEGVSPGSPVFSPSGHVVGIVTTVSEGAERRLVGLPIRYAKEIMGIKH